MPATGKTLHDVLVEINRDRARGTRVPTTVEFLARQAVPTSRAVARELDPGSLRDEVEASGVSLVNEGDVVGADPHDDVGLRVLPAKLDGEIDPAAVTTGQPEIHERRHGSRSREQREGGRNAVRALHGRHAHRAEDLRDRAREPRVVLDDERPTARHGLHDGAVIGPRWRRLREDRVVTPRGASWS